VNWIREDPVLQEWLTDTEANLLSDDRPKDLPVWKALLLYQGFDIKRILRIMCANRDTYFKEKGLEEVVADLMVGDRKVIFSYSNQKSMMNDIYFLIFLFVKPRSTNKKYTSKPLQQVKDITDWLSEKYWIDSTVNDPMASIDTDLITVPRIVACFPGKIC
jgi:hypothetical protein